MSLTLSASHAPPIRAAYRRFIRADDAGPLVEFALVAPMLMMFIMGIVDFSLAVLARNNLVSAVREGARLGAAQAGTDPCSATNKTTITTRVTSSLPGGVLPSGASITVDCPQTTLNAVTVWLVSVQVSNYPYKPVTPLFGMVKLVVGNATTFPLSAAAVYRWERF